MITFLLYRRLAQFIDGAADHLLMFGLQVIVTLRFGCSY
jgi:hypothetical protein